MLRDYEEKCSKPEKKQKLLRQLINEVIVGTGVGRIELHNVAFLHTHFDKYNQWQSYKFINKLFILNLFN